MPQSFCRYSRSAFTLIEILIVAVIFSILSLAVGRFLITFLNLKLSAETIQRIRQEGNYALDQIDYLLRSGLTMPDVCVGRIRPTEPSNSSFGFNLHHHAHAVTDNPDPNNIIPVECVGEPKDPDPTSVITKEPIHCELNPTQSGYSSYHSKIYDTCQEKCHVYDQLRTNTQGLDEVYFVRNLVALADCDGSGGSSGCRQPSSPDEVSSLYLFRSLEVNRRHGNFSDFVTNSSQVQKIPLTNWRTGVGGEPFSVNNLRFYCFFDYFANSYVVHTSFDITYQRQSLSGRLQQVGTKRINERFERLSVVRNPYPFEY